jgi:signal transduction histidine kinase
MSTNAVNAVNTATDAEHTRLLLIDDDVDFAIANAEYLEEFDYLVKVAHDDQQAKQIITTFDAQIALIDLNLGSSNGIDLIPDLRQVSPDLICIMLTGKADMESTIKALRRGANDYLRKPVNLDELLAVLERCVKTQKLQAEKRAADIAREEAEAATRAKSNFLSTMSHELRTPLNAILGFAQVMESSTAEPLTEAQQTYVNYIINSGNNLLELINQVLELNKIEAGGLSVSFDYISAANIVQGAIDLIHNRADEKSIEIRVLGCDDDLPLVWTDGQQLIKGLYNLLSNAVKYNRTGGRVTLSCQVIADQKLRISVKDTGCGIPAEEQSRLFSPFERLGHEAGAIGGSGIGLSITKQIAELIGGNIGFDSKQNEGSTFWVDVPLSSQHALI